MLSQHFANGRRAALSDGSVMQAKNITRQRTFPNKSVLLSAHNHLNNMYLMACTTTQGVELLGGLVSDTASSTIYKYSEVIVVDTHTQKKPQPKPW